MTGWNYAARKVNIDHEVWYELCECYPNLMEEGDTIIPHTESVLCPTGDTPAALAKWLRLAADDVEKYEPIEYTEETENDR
jgi:hypothetical protein